MVTDRWSANITYKILIFLTHPSEDHVDKLLIVHTPISIHVGLSNKLLFKDLCHHQVFVIDNVC